MAGLSSLISNVGTQQTTLPSWYDTAQQNVVNQATSANAAAPTPQQTVGQQAVNALSGPTNAFTQAGSTLQNIASGAASPWNVDTSGNVTPNTQTALGGLFAAQQNQLNQLLPTITAPTTAQGIGSGQFGSLRSQTATDTAAANALAQLQSAQMQSALQNQATGVQAGSAAGNVAQQNINNLLTTGQYQQAAPYINAANLGNILAGVQPGTTVSNTTQLSPLNQVMGLATALGGTSTGGLLGSLFGTPGSGTQGQAGYVAPTTGILGAIGNLFNGSSTSTPVSDATQAAQNASGTANINSGNPVPDIGTGALPTDTTGGGYVDPTTGESVGS
jgi:hypothetical protein